MSDTSKITKPNSVRALLSATLQSPIIVVVPVRQVMPPSSTTPTAIASATEPQQNDRVAAVQNRPVTAAPLQNGRVAAAPLRAIVLRALEYQRRAIALRTLEYQRRQLEQEVRRAEIDQKLAKQQTQLTEIVFQLTNIPSLRFNSKLLLRWEGNITDSISLK